MIVTKPFIINGLLAKPFLSKLGCKEISYNKVADPRGAI